MSGRISVSELAAVVSDMPFRKCNVQTQSYYLCACM